ncbi:MAG: hypothetical protein ABID04_02315, partial [Patescibacteria group bacterium]
RIVAQPFLTGVVTPKPGVSSIGIYVFNHDASGRTRIPGERGTTLPGVVERLGGIYLYDDEDKIVFLETFTPGQERIHETIEPPVPQKRRWF